LSIGDFVSAGQFLGISGSTGNSSGSHLHLTLQKMPGGLSGYVIDSVINPEPFLERF
jgi:murein DD-endopeptidase MepM/ murein hydrolase activator NlpD